MHALKTTILVIITLSLTGLSGCGKKGELIDLDKVLDQFDKTMAEFDAKRAPEVKDAKAKAKGLEALSPEQQDKVFIDRFNIELSRNLNNAKIYSKPLGTRLTSKGEIEGFTDSNRNLKIDGKDKAVFRLEIDQKRNRVIASDVEHDYHRDTSYNNHRHHSSSGFGSGYIIGSMVGRQRHSGVDTRRYDSMSMNKKGYHKSASTKSRSSSSSSSKSRSGSRSTFGGK